MESLNETRWDVVIEGTGLQQSLLALALSRSGKNILHLDSNEYYGGPDAAFSLLEAADWTKISSEKPAPPFSNVSIRQPESKSSNKLAPSRSYTLTLSPQIIYSKSKLLGQLVSSQVYRQLEFQAVGNWWIFSKTDATLKRLPNGREDVFSDRSIDVRAKRGLMKFLKFVIDFENQKDVWTASADTPLDEFLAQQFQLPETMQNVIGALTLSLDEPTKTTVAYSLPRIARHLTSIGVFGPGFGSVVPKWGGGAEIAQVSCRAGAVGGSVYVLGTGISSVTNDGGLALTSGDAVQSAFTVRTQDILKEKGEDAGDSVMKSISIISSDMGALFRATVEGAPSGAVAVIAFPGGSLGDDTSFQYPVYVMAHSNETGECPQDQCVLYASTRNVDDPHTRLSKAVACLSETCPADTNLEDTEKPSVLFEIQYEQSRQSSASIITDQGCDLPTPSLDLAFDDAALDTVEEAWRKIMGESATLYMTFKPREQFDDEDDE